MPVNWNLGVMPDVVGNALSAFEAGHKVGQENKKRNALATYAATPNDANLAAVAPYDPELVMRERERLAKEQREKMIGAVGQQALKGDVAAMEKLFALDPDLWARLDTRGQQQLKTTNSYMGQAAMQIGRLPEEARAQAWSTMVQQAEAGGMDIPDYLEAYSPNSLDTAVRMAGVVENYVKQFEPDYMAVPYDATLVNTRDPASLQQFGQGAAPVAGPPPAAIEALRANPALQDQFEQKYGQGSAARALGQGGAGASRIGSNFLDGL